MIAFGQLILFRMDEFIDEEPGEIVSIIRNGSVLVY